MEMTTEWAMDPRDANREVKERLIDLLEALWLFLEAFFLWTLFTAGPQLWAALRAIWGAIVAIRWGVSRMWGELTVEPKADALYHDGLTAFRNRWNSSPVNFSDSPATVLDDLPCSPSEAD